MNEIYKSAEKRHLQKCVSDLPGDSRAEAGFQPKDERMFPEKPRTALQIVPGFQIRSPKQREFLCVQVGLQGSVGHGAAKGWKSGHNHRESRSLIGERKSFCLECSFLERKRFHLFLQCVLNLAAMGAALRVDPIREHFAIYGLNGLGQGGR